MKLKTTAEERGARIGLLFGYAKDMADDLETCLAEIERLNQHIDKYEQVVDGNEAQNG